MVLAHFDLDKFAKRLRELREEKGMSMMEFSRASDISHTSMHQWEHAKRMPSADTIFRLARFFGCSTDYLIGLKDED